VALLSYDRSAAFREGILDLPSENATCPECRVQVRTDRLARHLAKHRRAYSAIQRQMTRWQRERECKGNDSLLVARSGKERSKRPASDPALGKSAVAAAVLSAEEISQGVALGQARCPQCDAAVRADRLAKHLVKHVSSRAEMKKRRPKSTSVRAVSGGLPETSRRRH